MFIGILFYTIYMLAAACTAWVAQTIFYAHLETHPSTRERGLGWIAWPMGVLTGITWPITIPIAIIIAGVTK
jgi:hypothetical protein